MLRVGADISNISAKCQRIVPISAFVKVTYIVYLFSFFSHYYTRYITKCADGYIGMMGTQLKALRLKPLAILRVTW